MRGYPSIFTELCFLEKLPVVPVDLSLRGAKGASSALVLLLVIRLLLRCVDRTQVIWRCLELSAVAVAVIRVLRLLLAFAESNSKTSLLCSSSALCFLRKWNLLSRVVLPSPLPCCCSDSVASRQADVRPSVDGHPGMPFA